MLKRPTVLFAVLASLLGMQQAKADIIVGPTISPTDGHTHIGGSDSQWGIDFTALDNSVLTSFDYTHRTADFGNNFSGANGTSVPFPSLC